MMHKAIVVALFLAMAGAGNAYAQSAMPELAAQIRVLPVEEVKGWRFDPATQTYAHPPSLAGIKKEATAGNAVAQFMMSNLYALGLHGQKIDSSDAIRYMTLSANQGYLPAIKNLAQCYRMGSLVERDADKAILLYTAAAEYGDVWSMSQLGSLYQIDGFHKVADQKSKNWEKAIYWYTKASDKGDSIGLYNLANAYKVSDPKKAVELFKRLVESDNVGVMYPTTVAGLADLYYSYADRGVPRNLPEAIRLLEIAAMLGEASSQHRLGVMYYEAEGLERDDLKAYTWLKLSAANKDPEGVEDFEAVRDQITPDLMKQVDQNSRQLSKKIASNLAELRARYVKYMAAQGITVTYPAQ